MKKERNKRLVTGYRSDIKIRTTSDHYEVGNDEFISKTNVLKNGKEYEWWNDYEFLLK